MATVLVTGGAGYIGSHACKLLRARGHTPVAFDNLATGWRDAVKFGPFVRGDLLDPVSLREAFAAHRPDAVMHFAALSDVVDYDEQLTGKRREAIYFGVQAIFQKTMIGISIAAFGIIAFIGSDSNVSEIGLKLVWVAAAASFLIGFFVFMKYPIREKNGGIVIR